MILAMAVAQVATSYLDYDRMTEAQVLALDCIKVAFDADRFVGQCWDRQAEIWDRRVGLEYVMALKRVDPEMRRPLRASQKAWLRYRSAKCALWDDVKGTLADRLPPLCRLETNRHRAEELAEVDSLSG